MIVDLNSLGNDPSVLTFSNFFLKLFAQIAETENGRKKKSYESHCKKVRGGGVRSIECRLVSTDLSCSPDGC